MSHEGQKKYNQLLEKGFCTFSDILPATFLTRLQEKTDELTEAKQKKISGEVRSQGIMIQTNADPLFAELIVWQGALDALSSLGFTEPKYTNGYVISKPPRSRRLFWHYDWFAWQDPSSYEAEPQQLFLMYYLDNTQPENGCLRVIPGSHRNHNELHDLIGEPHSKELSIIEDYQHPAFSTRSDEIDVPIAAGDLLIGDSRLLHATHENQSDEKRTVITLWFQPKFDLLPDRIKAQMTEKIQSLPDDWPAEARSAVKKLFPSYQGKAEPYGRDLYRQKQ